MRREEEQLSHHYVWPISLSHSNDRSTRIIYKSTLIAEIYLLPPGTRGGAAVDKLYSRTVGGEWSAATTPAVPDGGM